MLVIRQLKPSLNVQSRLHSCLSICVILLSQSLLYYANFAYTRKIFHACYCYLDKADNGVLLTPRHRSVSEERFRSVSVEVTLGARSFSRALEHARTLVSHFRRSLIGRRILSETVPNVTIYRPDFIGA